MSKLLFPLLFLCLGVAVAIAVNAKFIAPQSVDLSQVVTTTPPQMNLSPKPSPSGTPVIERSNVLIDVPFVAQAPTGNWKDPRQQDGCEEAAAYMAVLWAKGEKASSSLSELEKKIIEVSDWEEQQYGSYHDTSAKDTIERIYKGYFQYNNIEVRDNVSIQSIKEALSQGKVVQVPADGQKLNNPNFTAPGPERHNLLIIGYDDISKQFITNDNGTRQGKSYKYSYDVLLNAIRDYPTGDHLPIKENKKVMIVVSKE
jgi:hypothetical protein